MAQISQLHERIVKKLHKDFVRDLKEVYVKEARLLEHETELINLMKKYQKRILVKPIFRHARWYSGRGKPKPVNYYSKLLSNFETLIDLLNQNLMKQYNLFGVEKVNAMELVGEEKIAKKESPKIVSFLEKKDERVLNVLTDISQILEEFATNFVHLKRIFGNAIFNLESVHPQEFLDWLATIYAEIERKNNLVNMLKELTKIEEKLDSLIIAYDLGRYPLVK